ncbi:JmjC domain-containing protein [Plasmodiophora brassicae]
MALSGLFNGNRFSFGFDADQDRSEKEHPKPCTIAADAGDSGCLAVVINDIDAGSVQFCARQVVRVDWSSSSWRQIAVVDKPGQAPVFVDAKCLSLMDTASRRVDDDLWLLDIVFGFDTKTIPTGKLHFSTNPLTIEPSLQSIVWPLHVNAFMRDVYNRRALVVHAGVHRTRFLRDSLSDFNVDSLLDSASRIVVWMRSAVDGRMQYLDVGSPDVARACYRAGHSLYFNPEYDFQKRFIRGICQDLGMDFTRAIQDGGIGGDVEVFAVAGRHHTPWHWDAQHNFTVQLSGTKHWAIARGPQTDPMTNFHPRSSNSASLADDTIMLRRCGLVPDQLEPPGDSSEAVSRFTLRPGSVLYMPAGFWHRVDVIDDEPSLSINFSIDGARWADVLANRLLPLLWADPEWRRRPDMSQGPDHARQHFVSLIHRSMKSILEDLTTDPGLPDGVFEDARPASDEPVSIDGTFRDEHDGIACEQILRRSHSVVLHRLQPSVYSLSLGQARFADGFKPEFTMTLTVPAALEPVAYHLSTLAQGLTFAMADLRRLVPAADHPALNHLISELIFRGYLIPN